MKSPFDGLRAFLGIQASSGTDPGYGALSAFVDYLQGAMTKAGISVTPALSLRIPDFAACVAIHSEAMGRIPLVVLRRLPGGGKERAPDHIHWKMLKVKTDADLTAVEWRSLQQTDIETHGNSYSLKIVINGQVRELLHLPARRVEKTRTPSGETQYTVYDQDGVRAQRKYSAGSILHQRGPFGDSLLADAPSKQYRELFGIAYALEMFIGANFKNGLRPSVVFSTDTTMTDKAGSNLRDWAKEYSGSENAGKALFMHSGMKPHPFSQTFDEGQVAQLSDVIGLKIARVCRVPPHMLGYNIAQPRANMEQQAREYLEMGLGSRVERAEQRLNVELFDGGEGEYFCEFLYEDLLKADPATRGKFYRDLVELGVMTRNEVRSRENLNPLPGLDEPLTPMNMNRGDERRDDRGRGARRGRAEAPEDEDEDDAEASADEGRTVVHIHQPPAPEIHNHIEPAAAPEIHTHVEPAVAEVLVPVHVHQPTPPFRGTVVRKVVRDGAGALERVEETSLDVTGQPTGTVVVKRVKRAPDGSIAEVIEDRRPAAAGPE